MGISVEGQKCPVCGAYIFDNDDLVFCPECGAPHHRDCYHALGHCAYKDKHGTDEGYKPDAAKSEPTEEKNQSSAEQIRKCRFCGEPMENDETFCRRCGRPQAVGPQPPFVHNITFDPMGGVMPDELIGDIPAKDIKAFVGVNTQRYLPRFKMLNNKKKKSWNWAAFLVPHVWFFYRKMYFHGIFFTALLIMASLFLLPLSAVVSTFPQEATLNTGALARYLMENFASIEKLPLILAAVGGIAELVIRIVAGFVGDRIYRKTAIEGVKRVKNTPKEETEEELPLKDTLARKGGVSTFLGLIMLFSFNLILEWISMIYIAL